MEGIRGTEHPLQTPIILESIFKNLDLDDLQKCRLVCRTWCHESGKAMRPLMPILIVIDEPHSRGPSKFLKLVQTNESTFFQAPFTEDFTVMDGVADCPRFWKTCGVQIKKLRLQNVIFKSALAFRRAIFKSCPNLKELVIFDVLVYGKPAPKPKKWVPPHFTQNRNLKTLTIYGTRDEFSIGWLELLSQYPCLEKLEARKMGDRFEDVFRALEVARQHDTSSWKLSEVALWGGGLPMLPRITLPPSFARVFGDGNLTLTILFIGGIDFDSKENVTIVQTLVAAHAQSLKKLTIFTDQTSADDISEMDIFPLPGNQVFENVKVLKLIGAKTRSTRFLQAFPNLKMLMLDLDEIAEDTQTPHVTLDDCTQLTIYSQIEEADDFKRLFGLLPNLKKLNIVGWLDNELFSLICEYWPDLTHLEMVWSNEMEVDDAGISGYDRKHVRKINKRGRRRSWRPITVRRANLSSLKNLQNFSWHVGSEVCSRVGYCTKACGILELPQLKHLYVIRQEGEDEDGLPEDYVPVFKSLSERFPWDARQRIQFD